MDRILNVLIRYFDEDMGTLITQHQASRKVNIVGVYSRKYVT